MSHPLDGCRLKIDRAIKHLEILQATVDNFVQGPGSDTVGIKFHLKPGECVVRFIVEHEPPLEWAVIIGEILYNLRSSLDHLAWQLVIANGHHPGRHTEFPIFRDESSFRRTSKMNGMSSAAQAAIERLQPFRTGQVEPEMERLWILQDLCNIDKHRALHLSGFFLKTSQYSVAVPDQYASQVEAVQIFHRGPLEDQAVLAHFRFPSGMDGNVQVQVSLSFDVTLQEGSQEVRASVPLQSTGLLDLLGQLTNSVRDFVLPTLESLVTP